MPQLVIIIGAARSGTKLLRSLLAESSQVAAVPYDVNYVWRHGNEWRPDDCIPAEASSERNRQYIERKLATLAARAKRGAYDYLVEKTVSNVFRVPYVQQLFPEALFIHLVRDGRDVAESAARMWSQPGSIRYLLGKLRYFPMSDLRYGFWYLGELAKSYGRGRSGMKIWGPRYPGIELDVERLTALELASKQWSESVRAATEGLARIPPDRWVTIRYEDLVASPDVLAPALDLTGISERRNIWRAWRENVRSDRIGGWRALSADERQVVCSIQAQELSMLGYASETLQS